MAGINRRQEVQQAAESKEDFAARERMLVLVNKERWWNLIELRVSQIMLGFILLLLSYQVVMRYIFKNTNSWSEELARYVFIFFIYLTACVAIYKNVHIKIDAFLSVYPRRIRKWVKILGNAVFLVYAAGIAYYGYQYTASIFAAGTVATGTHIKMAYVYAIIPVSHLIMALRLIQLTYNMVKRPEAYQD